jgi:hypothetical protein
MLTFKAVIIQQITIIQISTGDILSDNLLSKDFVITSSAFEDELVSITSTSLLSLYFIILGSISINSS